MKKVIVVGAGPAGMFAAVAAAEKGNAVLLLEKNEKLGKKLFLTGKGRCNLTNAAGREDVFRNIVSNPKFFHSAFAAYDNRRVISFFEGHGVKTKTERGSRVFPVSDHSSDVIGALRAALKRAGVWVRLSAEADGLLLEGGRCAGVSLKRGGREYADAVILATGGLSYRSTGSTGDGYAFAKRCGHTVTELTPSLVPFTVKEEDAAKMQGLSLKNVRISIQKGQKLLFEDFGEMLFTHFGISGPLVLRASSMVGKELLNQELRLSIDLKPALDFEQLDARLLRDFRANQNRRLKNAVHGLLPSKMLPVFLERCGISPEKQINVVTKEERRSLAILLKDFPFTLNGLRGFDEAIITKGGICVKEVNPSTMESKLVPGLYFAGEILDLDAMTGGYNLQIAWSTGYLAGSRLS